MMNQEQRFFNADVRQLADRSAQIAHLEEVQQDARQSKELFFELLNLQAGDEEVEKFRKCSRFDYISIVSAEIQIPGQWPTFEVLEREDGKKHLAVVIPHHWNLQITDTNRTEAMKHVKRLTTAVFERSQDLISQGTRFMNGEEFAEFLINLSSKKLERI